MTISLTISDTLGGYSLPDTTEMGDVTPGNSVGHKNVFISHDATVNPITGCEFYVYKYSGSNYLGSDIDADFTQYMAWGDAATGGVMYSQTRDSGWTSDDKFAAGWTAFKNSTGDINAPVALSDDSITDGAGTATEIQVGETAHLQFDVDVPSSSPGTTGYKAFSIVFAYSATS